jgi:hypothetical protein
MADQQRGLFQGRLDVQRRLREADVGRQRNVMAVAEPAQVDQRRKAEPAEVVDELSQRGI